MPSERVTRFYDLDSFAVIGVSRSKNNMGWLIYNQLLKLGKRVYAIGVQGGQRDSIRLYPGLKALPEMPEGIIVCVNPSTTKGLLDDLKNAGTQNIWFQQGSYDSEVSNLSSAWEFQPLKGCAFMYMPGASAIHRFHRAINEFFGKGYK